MVAPEEGDREQDGLDSWIPRVEHTYEVGRSLWVSLWGGGGSGSCRLAAESPATSNRCPTSPPPAPQQWPWRCERPQTRHPLSQPVPALRFAQHPGCAAPGGSPLLLTADPQPSQGEARAGAGAVRDRPHRPTARAGCGCRPWKRIHCALVFPSWTGDDPLPVLPSFTRAITPASADRCSCRDPSSQGIRNQFWW